jgi:acid stress chaperone HdeB
MTGKTITAAAAILATFLATTGAQAQVTIDASKITCEQFVFTKVAPIRSIALWLSGYYSGKKGTTTVDLQAFEQNAQKLERFCKLEKNLKTPVMQAVEQALGGK